MLMDKEVSSREITQAVLDRIEKIDERIHAYLVVTKEEALEQARRLTKRLAGGGALLISVESPWPSRTFSVPKG